MTTNTTNNVISIDDEAEAVLAKHREAIGEAIGTQYGLTQEYAASLFNYFRADWFEVEHNDISDEAKPILTEAKKFREALKARGHSNPSVIWTRVRKAGRTIAYGADAEEGNAKPVRSIKLRMVEELTKIYKAAKREDSLADDTALSLIHVTSALTALGVDVAMLNPAK